MTALTPYHEQLEEQKGRHATWDGMPEYVKDNLAHAVLDMIRERMANGQL